MGDKGKGRDAGSAKKAKTPKTGNRPHEERLKQDGIKPAAPDPAKR